MLLISECPINTLAQLNEEKHNVVKFANKIVQMLQRLLLLSEMVLKVRLLKIHIISLNQFSSATIDPEVLLPKQGLVQIFLQIA